jgi:hypothetical protein
LPNFPQKIIRKAFACLTIGAGLSYNKLSLEIRLIGGKRRNCEAELLISYRNFVPFQKNQSFSVNFRFFAGNLFYGGAGHGIIERKPMALFGKGTGRRRDNGIFPNRVQK